MRRIQIVDTTIREITEKSNFSITFRDKIEVAKHLDKLHVNVIELPLLVDDKADSLLIKTIASVTNNSIISCNVGFSVESIDKTYEAVKGASKKRLHIVLPTSPTQMEYVAHKKAKQMIDYIKELVSHAKSLCDDVEFSAVDATRSDREFLKTAIKTAIDAGANIINICDSAALMVNGEFKEFIEDIKSIEGFSDIAFSVECSDEVSTACSNSFVAATLGACQVKTSIMGSFTPSLETMVNLFNMRGDSYGMNCTVRTLQIQKALKQLAWLGNADKKLPTYDKDEEDDKTDKFVLKSNADIDELNHIIESLGYDLSYEDSARVYEEFKTVSSKKENITTHELEAIIASTALEVVPTYKLNDYVITSGHTINSTATVILKKDDKLLTGLALGDGPIEAALLAIEQIIGHHYELDDFVIQSVTEGSEAIGSTLVKLRSNGKLYSGMAVSADIVGSGIRAYINALNKIVAEESHK